MEFFSPTMGIGIMTPKIIETAIATAKKYNNSLRLTLRTTSEDLRGQPLLLLTPDAEKNNRYPIKNKESLLQAGKDLLEKTSSEMVLLTRGGEGMVLFEKNGNITNIPAFNKTEVLMLRVPEIPLLQVLYLLFARSKRSRSRSSRYPCRKYCL